MSLCSLGLSCEPINESKTSGQSEFCNHGRFRLTCEWCLIEIMQKDIVELKSKIESLNAVRNDWLNPIDELFRRVSKLEELNQKCFDANSIKQIEERFEKIEENIKRLGLNYDFKGDLSDIHVQLDKIYYSNKHYDSQLDKLQNQISNWEEEFYFIKDKLRCTDKKPHKCVLCDGKGTYQSLQPTPPYVLHNECEACDGKRVIWG